MRTLTLYSILFTIFLQVSLSAMQSEKENTNADAEITLESNDGACYTVPKNLLEKSSVLKECYEDTHSPLIPIAGLNGEQISLLLPYLKRGSPAGLERSLSKKNRGELISVLNSANYLDINFLLEPLQKSLAFGADIECRYEATKEFIAIRERVKSKIVKSSDYSPKTEVCWNNGFIIESQQTKSYLNNVFRVDQQGLKNLTTENDGVLVWHNTKNIPIDPYAQIVNKNINRSIAKLLIGRHAGSILKGSRCLPIDLHGYPFQIAVSPNVYFLAILHRNMQLSLLNVKKSEQFDLGLFSLPKHGSVSEIAFNKSSNKFITANYESIRVWDIPANKLCLAKNLHVEDVKDNIIDIDGNLIAYSVDRLVRLWDIRSQESVRNKLKGHADTISCIVAHDNGSVLLTASRDYTIKEWDLRKLSEARQTFRGHDTAITAIAYEPTCQQFATGDTQGIIKVWDSAKGQELYTLEDNSVGSINSLIFGNKDRLMSCQKKVKFWDVKTGQVKKSLENSTHLVGNRKGSKLCVVSPETPSSSSDSKLKIYFYRYHNTDRLDTIDKAKKALIASYKLQYANKLK